MLERRSFQFSGTSAGVTFFKSQLEKRCSHLYKKSKLLQSRNKNAVHARLVRMCPGCKHMVALEIDTVDFAFHRGAEREHLAEDFKVVLGNSGGTVGGSRFRTGCPFIETKS